MKLETLIKNNIVDFSVKTNVDKTHYFFIKIVKLLTHLHSESFFDINDLTFISN